jgi:hypothetical protein
VLKRNKMKSDVILLLHELMYKPKGNMRFSEIRRAQSYKFSIETRVLLMYCVQRSFVNLDNDYIQLTDAGLDYYLANKRQLS